jgi:hypothetical protein
MNAPRTRILRASCQSEEACRLTADSIARAWCELDPLLRVFYNDPSLQFVLCLTPEHRQSILATEFSIDNIKFDLTDQFILEDFVLQNLGIGSNWLGSETKMCDMLLPYSALLMAPSSGLVHSTRSRRFVAQEEQILPLPQLELEALGSEPAPLPPPATNPLPTKRKRCVVCRGLGHDRRFHEKLGEEVPPSRNKYYVKKGQPGYRRPKYHYVKKASSERETSPEGDREQLDEILLASV